MIVKETTEVIWFRAQRAICWIALSHPYQSETPSYLRLAFNNLFQAQYFKVTLLYYIGILIVSARQDSLRCLLQKNKEFICYWTGFIVNCQPQGIHLKKKKIKTMLWTCNITFCLKMPNPTSETCFHASNSSEQRNRR